MDPGQIFWLFFMLAAPLRYVRRHFDRACRR